MAVEGRGISTLAHLLILSSRSLSHTPKAPFRCSFAPCPAQLGLLAHKVGFCEKSAKFLCQYSDTKGCEGRKFFRETEIRIGMGCPGKWWICHSWRCLRKAWTWLSAMVWWCWVTGWIQWSEVFFNLNYSVIWRQTLLKLHTSIHSNWHFKLLIISCIPLDFMDQT